MAKKTYTDSELRNAIRERLKQALDKANIAAGELAEFLGVSNGRVVEAYLRGDRTPQLELLVKIADRLQISLDWLLAGKGAVKGTELIKRDSERVFLDRLEQWESKITDFRRTCPPLFDSWLMLPELVRLHHRQRRGVEMSDADMDLHQEVNGRRWNQFAKSKWRAREVCSKGNVQAMVDQSGAYAELPPEVALAQLERVLEPLTNYAERYEICFTPWTFRFAYRVYDDHVVVVNSIYNYIVMSDDAVAGNFVKEFEAIWRHDETDRESRRYLREQIEHLKARISRR